jgi:predicted Zn-dependent protease with MMP-like domain
MVTRAERRLFDRLLDELMDRLPESIHELFEQTPLIVEDEPDDAIRAELMGDDEAGDDLLGVFSGRSIMEESVEVSGELPDDIRLFRGPILRLARDDARAQQVSVEDALYEQVRVTLLHEVGHHFGLNEDDLDRLGYA